MLWDLQGWVGVRDSQGVVWIPTRPVGGSEPSKEAEGGKARSTYDKVDGLGETPVGDRAERSRLLVCDTLGMYGEDERERERRGRRG